MVTHLGPLARDACAALVEGLNQPGKPGVILSRLSLLFNSPLSVNFSELDCAEPQTSSMFVKRELGEKRTSPNRKTARTRNNDVNFRRRRQLKDSNDSHRHLGIRQECIDRLEAQLATSCQEPLVRGRQREVQPRVRHLGPHVSEPDADRTAV